MATTVKQNQFQTAADIEKSWRDAYAKDYYPTGFFRAFSMTERQLRLFAVACCRHPLIWDLLDDPRSREAVEFSELYAEGLCEEKMLQAANDAAWSVRHEKWLNWRVTIDSRTEAEVEAAFADAAASASASAALAAFAASASAEAASASAALAAFAASASAASDSAAFAAGHSVEAYAASVYATSATTSVSDPTPEVNTYVASNAADFAADAAVNPVLMSLSNARVLAREEIRGYQGRLMVSFVGPGWTFSSDWRTDTVVALARTMYESREFSAMPILADALQDIGCDDTVLLESLRSPDSVWAKGSRILDELLR